MAYIGLDLMEQELISFSEKIRKWEETVAQLARKFKAIWVDIIILYWTPTATTAIAKTTKGVNNDRI